MQILCRVPLLFCLAASCLAAPGQAQAEPGVWRESATGYAIGGYDPVAYRTRGAAVKGEKRHAHRWGGAAWTFENEGNRAAFAHAPDTYAPRFFGFDPLEVARGEPVQGNPVLWVVDETGLYLFSTSANREDYLRRSAEIRTHAEAAWPTLSRTLAGVRDR